jgi:hypothetical protein
VDANNLLDASVTIVPTQLAYMHIPANELRQFVDGMFPTLAKYPLADSVSGYGHRYAAGHDLFLDIPKTISSHGPFEGIKHAGHVLLTDFPTKAGIPIPGLSQSGLGKLLEEAGIHRGWMQINLCETGVGFFAIAEGSIDLIAALHGSLKMDVGTFFDTFVEGSLEISFALITKNPILMAGGVENILAGIVASWNSLSVYVDPLDFFGSAGTSAFIGFMLAYGLAGENLSDAGKDAIRSGAIGAFFALSPAFGFGALSGFTAYRLGSILAKQQEELMRDCLSLDEQTYRLLWDEICQGNLPVQKLLDCTVLRHSLFDSAPVLPNKIDFLSDEFVKLSSKCQTLRTNASMLGVNIATLQTKPTVLSDDPSSLIKWYRSFA